MDATGTENSILTISAPGTGAAVLNLTNTGTGPSVINMGPLGEGVALAVTTAAPNALVVNDPATSNTYLSVDVGANIVTLGSLTAVGTVEADAELYVKTSASGANQLSLYPISATQSRISQTVTSGGALYLGSSTTYDATIEVVDNGTQAYVIVGGNGGNGVYLNGTSANLSIVGTTAATNTNGELVLAASTGATNTINITDTTMTVDQVLTLNDVPVFLGAGGSQALAPTNYGQGAHALTMPPSDAPGFYLTAVYPTGVGVSDQDSLNCCISMMWYWSGTAIVAGGAAPAQNRDLVSTFSQAAFQIVNDGNVNKLNFVIQAVGNIYIGVQHYRLFDN